MKSFPSKILLFGEHIVNTGAHALAIPYSKFYGQLSFDSSHHHYLEPSSLILNKILAFIEANSKLNGVYDLQALKKDIDKDLVFHLNIPVGYGLGSSGAIVSCIFDKYAKSKDFNHQELKRILGETEGVFHGKSSGLDPLVSYSNQAIFIDESTNTIETKLKWQDDFEIFLLDTKLARKTAPLVKDFLNRYKEDNSFAKVLQEEIIPLNNRIINNFLKNNHSDTLYSIERLSTLQLKHLDYLILEPHKALWRNGLNSKEYFLKICGAGGGGFMLGFCKSKQAKLPFEVIWI